LFLEKSGNNKVSLRTADKQYLDIDNNKFDFSSNKEELTIAKVSNYQGEISGYREVVEDIQFHLEEKKEVFHRFTQTLTQTNHSDQPQTFTLSANRTYIKQDTYN